MRWVLLFILSSPAAAHEKNLDEYGCHTQFNRGQYHCHAGEFKDRIWKSRQKARAEMGGRVEREAYDEDSAPKKTEKRKVPGADGCSPMDARGEGRGRRWIGWAWNGLLCTGLKGSRCVGRDCGSLYRSQAECERARYRCPTSAEYYLRLKKKCGKFDGCCNRSIKLMQANGTRPVLEDGCPEGYVNEMLRCVSSLRWCAPKPHRYSEGSDPAE